ncbi:hypothetical protein CE143_12885 [Photorhabdus luminescens]|uniref:Uncharacterized protein n=1 Tax=Photorhabdus akhurstii TaxID=171438 RepID=A0ABX8LXQ9_9GAMM|nr:hypothetical protein [Photorhabdus akhurstii]QXF33938.1 hypothetical protein B0X70_12885 [Photorhabdus akhurstii]UJD75753.1 hypothetical protein CE143_12885 [Photorhabdus luminescens]
MAKNASYRKELLDPQNTDIYDSGAINNYIAEDRKFFIEKNDNGNLHISGRAKSLASVATDNVYIARGIMYTGDVCGKAWLNVQLLQNAMDAPKIIG